MPVSPLLSSCWQLVCRQNSINIRARCKSFGHICPRSGSCRCRKCSCCKHAANPIAIGLRCDAARSCLRYDLLALSVCTTALSCCLIGARIHVLSDEQAAANTPHIQPGSSHGTLRDPVSGMQILCTHHCVELLPNYCLIGATIHVLSDDNGDDKATGQCYS